MRQGMRQRKFLAIFSGMMILVASLPAFAQNRVSSVKAEAADGENEGGSLTISSEWSKRTPASYKGELLKDIDRYIAQIKKQKTLKKKKEALQKLKEFVEAEKQGARNALEAARQTDMTEKQVEVFDSLDTEVVDLWYAFEFVFDDVLSPNFTEKASSRQGTCRELPQTIRFRELVHQPEGAELSEYRKKAIEVLSEFCKDISNEN